MSMQDILSRNRIILSHFDTYSAALVFARWDKTLLMPMALPESAAPMAAPAAFDSAQSGEAARVAAIDAYGLNAEEVIREDDFDAWMQTDNGPVRIHLLRFNTTDAPLNVIEPHGGVYKSISELRGSPMIELNLLRQVFNLIVGGSKARS